MIGDAAYGLASYMLSPHTRTTGLNAKRRNFNHFLSQLRGHVENAFGMLIMRFGCLYRKLRVRFDRRAPLISACMRLHNFCIDANIAVRVAFFCSRPQMVVSPEKTQREAAAP